MLKREQAERKLFVMDTPDPKIKFTLRAMLIIEQAAQQNNDEVGMYGVVDKEGDAYIIRDIFIPKQQVNGGTCEILPEGGMDLMMWLEGQGRGADIPKLRFWCHSHINMGVGPSPQDKDNSRMHLRQQGGEWFIRAIVNKKGDMSVAFYDKPHNIIIEDVEWSIGYGNLEAEVIEYVKTEVLKNVAPKTYDYPTRNGANTGNDDKSITVFRRGYDWQNPLGHHTPGSGQSIDDVLKEVESGFRTFEFQGVEFGPS